MWVCICIACLSFSLVFTLITIKVVQLEFRALNLGLNSQICYLKLLDFIILFVVLVQGWFLVLDTHLGSIFINNWHSERLHCIIRIANAFKREKDFPTRSYFGVPV